MSCRNIFAGDINFSVLEISRGSEFYKYMVDYMTKSVRYDLNDHGLYINAQKIAFFRDTSSSGQRERLEQLKAAGS